MKKYVNERLKEQFLIQFNNAKKMVAVEEKQKPFWSAQTENLKILVCFN